MNHTSLGITIAYLKGVRIVEMCKFYFWNGKPRCEKGYLASKKCHSRRYDCNGYKPSLHYEELR